MGVIQNRLYGSPLKAIQEAADQVLEGAEIGRTFNHWAPIVARRRMLNKASRIAGLAEDERYEAEYDKAIDQMWAKVDAGMSGGKKDSLRHLNVKKGAERAWDRFDRALALASETGVNKPNCAGKPGLYSDYDDDSLPTAEQAYELCFGCPLLALCASYAEQEQPKWGVWAGEVWPAADSNRKPTRRETNYE